MLTWHFKNLFPINRCVCFFSDLLWYILVFAHQFMHNAERSSAVIVVAVVALRYCQFIFDSFPLNFTHQHECVYVIIALHCRTNTTPKAISNFTFTHASHRHTLTRSHTIHETETHEQNQKTHQFVVAANQLWSTIEWNKIKKTKTFNVLKSCWPNQLVNQRRSTHT